MDLTDSRFPFHLPDQAVTIDGLRVLLQLKMRPGTSYDDDNPLKASLKPPDGVAGPDQEFKLSQTLPGVVEATFTGGDPGTGWVLTLKGIPSYLGLAEGTNRLDPTVLQDAFLLCMYSLIARKP